MTYAYKQPKPTPSQITLTPDEIKQINRQVALAVTWYVLKRILLIPVIALAFLIAVIFGLTSTQLIHALSGEHNVREQH